MVTEGKKMADNGSEKSIPVYISDETINAYYVERLKKRFVTVTIPGKDKVIVYSYDGTRWVSDAKSELYKAIRAEIKAMCDTVDTKYKAAFTYLDEFDKKDEVLLNSLKAQRTALFQYQNHNWVSRLVKVFMEDSTIESGRFDTNYNLIPFKDGLTYEIDTGNFRESRADDYITMVANASGKKICNAELNMERWTREVLQYSDGHEDEARFLQKTLGSSLLRTVAIRAIVYLHGAKGKNGKTTFANAVRFAMGGLCRPVKSSFLSEHNERKDTEQDIMQALNYALCICDEADKNFKMSASRLKSLTGGSKSAGRRLYENDSEYQFSATILNMANFPPSFSGSDKAEADRVIVIPFTHDFSECANPNTPKELEAMSEEIVAWLIEGMKMFKAEGRGETPKRIKMATEQYIIDNDSLQMFINECCRVGPNEKCNSKKFYDEYAQHCRNELNGQIPISGKNVKAYMEVKGYTYKPILIDGKTNKGYDGISLKKDDTEQVVKTDMVSIYTKVHEFLNDGKPHAVEDIIRHVADRLTTRGSDDRPRIEDAIRDVIRMLKSTRQVLETSKGTIKALEIYKKERYRYEANYVHSIRFLGRYNEVN